VTKLSPGSGIPPRIAGGKYNALPPSRILDTRPGTQVGPYGQAVGPGGSIDVQVAGFPGSGVPASAAAAVLNVTVTDTTAPSYLTVYPKGAARPTASNLNWTAGSTVPNLVEVALGQGGMITLFNLQGFTDVVIDVEGYVSPPDQSATLDGLFHPVVPVRVLDTRPASQVGPYSTPVGPGGVISLNVCPSSALVPSDASVVLNVTATDTTAASYLTMWPHGALRPVASNLNWAAGQTVPNRVMVKPGAGCVVDIFNLAGSTDVVVDLNGWYNGPNGDDGTRFTGTVPYRILDTRPATQVGPYSQPIGTNSTILVPLPGVPAGATAVVINATVTDGTTSSFLTLWPAGSARPTASDLNWQAGQTVPNLSVVGLGQGGQIAVYNNAGSVDLVIDVVGYFS